MAKIDQYVKKTEKAQPKWVSIVRQRRYQMPKGYMPWRKISALVAMHLACHEEGRTFYERQDQATQLICLKLSQWFLQDAPLYCLTSELLSAFQEADLSNIYELFQGFETALPTFMLALPEGSLITSEGGEISFLMIHVADKLNPQLSAATGYGLTVPYLLHDGDKNIHISTVDSNTSTWVAGLTANKSGKLYDSGKILSAQDLSAEDWDDSTRIKKVGLQCLLALAYSPELLGDTSGSDTALTVFASRKAAKAQPNSARARKPRWLRSSQAKPLQRPPQGGTHASPRPHWRKPHDKRVPVGPRELGERKTVRIGAVWVNPD